MTNMVTVAEAAKILYGKKDYYYSVHRLIYKKKLKTAKKIGWIWVIKKTEINRLKKSKKY